MIQGVAIALAVGLTLGSSLGWYAKGRDVKADQTEALTEALAEHRTIAQDAINGFQKSWEEQAQLTYENLLSAGELRAEDNRHEAEVLKQVEENNRELREIIESFAMASDLGACQLTPEFVGLWNQARTTISKRTATDENRDTSGSNKP